MPTVHFDKLGEIGIVDDTSDYDLPRNAFTDGRNVRFNEKGVEKFKGQAEVYATPIANPYFAIPVQNGSDYFWFYASLTDLYVTDGNTHNNISAAGMTASYGASVQINWTGGNLGGGILVLNNGIDVPAQWAGSSLTDQFTALSNWPANMVARTLRQFKQFLVAADIDEGSGRDGTLLRWSHPAAPGGVPSTWDYTDDTNDSGRTTVSQGSDFIVDMKPLRDINIIYNENSIHSMQYVGGNNIFAFRKIFGELGLLSRRCAVELFGRHVILANENIIMHDGVQTQEFMNRRWKKWLFNTIDGTNYATSFVSINHTTNEVWFCIPESGRTLPNIALVWNWHDNTTTVRELPVGTAHIARGIVDPSASQAIQDQGGTYDEQAGLFDDQSYSAAKRYLLMCDTALTKFYRAEDTEQFDGSNITAYVQRDGLPLGRQAMDGTIKVDVTEFKFIARVWPIIEGTIGGVVEVYVGSRDFYGDTVSWSGPHSFVIGSTLKLDLRKAGRIIDIKFVSNTAIAWNLESFAVDFELGGHR